MIHIIYIIHSTFASISCYSSPGLQKKIKWFCFVYLYSTYDKMIRVSSTHLLYMNAQNILDACILCCFFCTLGHFKDNIALAHKLKSVFLNRSFAHSCSLSTSLSLSHTHKFYSYHSLPSQFIVLATFIVQFSIVIKYYKSTNVCQE